MTSTVLHEGSPESVGMDRARIDNVRALGASWLRNGDLPSFVLLVARRGTVVLHEAFGVRHPDDTLATLRTDSIFTVASCSKPVTAAAVMCLVEDGLIGLNRPFIDYVPEWNVPGVPGLEEASVADLLRHTSGIDELDAVARINAAEAKGAVVPEAAPGQHPALNRRIRLAAGVPLARRPGSAMLYSPLGFNLLGDIVRRISGRPFWQFVHERLFEPLGMNDSHFRLPAELRARRVFRRPGMPGTNPVPGFHGGNDSESFDALDLGSSGLASTALDFAIFLQMLLNRGTYDGRRVLSPATVAAMTRQQVDPSVPGIFPLVHPTTRERLYIEVKGGGYGYGLFLHGAGDRYAGNGSLHGPSAFGHIGYASATCWADPRYDLVGVMLYVSPRLVRDVPFAPTDLFQNAVYGAIAE